MFLESSINMRAAKEATHTHTQVGSQVCSQRAPNKRRKKEDLHTVGVYTFSSLGEKIHRGLFGIGVLLQDDAPLVAS